MPGQQLGEATIHSDLLFGLLDTSRAIEAPRVAIKARSLTLDWSRFKYFDPVVEADTLPGVLERALEHDRRYCLVQAFGHILNEIWQPEGVGAPLLRLERWLAARELLAAGVPRADGTLDSRCVVVNLARWTARGRPEISRLGEDVIALPDDFLRICAYLDPEHSPAARALERLLDGAIVAFDPAADDVFESAAGRFLAQVRLLTGELPRGVFVWNVEPYDDIETPPDDHRGPLDALYSVAAGFKPNRLLETHGFHAGTRVVYADYSAPGLRFRELLLERWDGRDYPAFLRGLFATMPSSEAFYCLWDGATPETVDWQAMEQRWRSELESWGGAAALASHWRHYRRLEHRFVRCDLLAERAALLEQIASSGEGAVWWSNAFFSFVSNWFHTAAERREIYRRFLAELAARAPRLLLYGASSDNIAVNGVRAAEYHAWFEREGGDELIPGMLQRCQIAF